MLKWTTTSQLSLLYQLRCFQNKNLWYNFQTLFARKCGLARPYFLNENESLQHCFSYGMMQMTMFLVRSFNFWALFTGFSHGSLVSTESPLFLRSRVRVRAWFLDNTLDGCFWDTRICLHIRSWLGLFRVDFCDLWTKIIQILLFKVSW